MEALIDFIFSNPLVIFLLLGLISTLSGKKTKEEKPTRPSRPVHTPVEMEREEAPRRRVQGQSLREIMEQMERQINEQMEQQKPKPVAVKEVVTEEVQRRNRYEQERQELELAKERNRRAKEEKARVIAAAAEKSPIYANDLTKQSKLTFDSSNVTQGIIYSEILSKPRALNPYQRGVKK